MKNRKQHFLIVKQEVIHSDEELAFLCGDR